MNSVCKFGWAELGRRSGKFAQPLHRSPALRVVFDQGSTLVPVNGGRLQPARLPVAFIEQWDSAVSSADRLLGTLMAGALLGGEFTAGLTIRSEEHTGSFSFASNPHLAFKFTSFSNIP